MHENPCRGKWNLVKDVTEYIHGPAKFYLCNEAGVYPVNEADGIHCDELKLVIGYTSALR